MHSRNHRAEPRPDRPYPGPTHVFFDAEGTLWVPRPGMDFDDFWADPDPRRALEVFELTPHIEAVLDHLRACGKRLVVVSKHDVHVLPALLRLFGLAHHFDDVLVNGHKGVRIVQWLRAHGLGPEHGLMVGDRHDLDIEPVEACGVRAILLDRSYNRGLDAVRLHDLRDLVGLIRLLDHAPPAMTSTDLAAVDAGTWTGLAPLQRPGVSRQTASH